MNEQLAEMNLNRLAAVMLTNLDRSNPLGAPLLYDIFSGLAFVFSMTYLDLGGLDGN